MDGLHHRGAALFVFFVAKKHSAELQGREKGEGRKA